MPSIKHTIRDLVRMAKDIESCAGKLGLLEERSRVVLEEGSLSGRSGYYLKTHSKDPGTGRTYIDVPPFMSKTGGGFVGTTKTTAGTAMEHILNSLRAAARSTTK